MPWLFGTVSVAMKGTGVTDERGRRGGRRWLTTNISPNTYLYFELGVPDATVGAKLDWVVKLDGREVYRESEKLMEPLESGYAFFMQFEADNVAQVQSWME